MENESSSERPKIKRQSVEPGSLRRSIVNIELFDGVDECVVRHFSNHILEIDKG